MDKSMVIPASKSSPARRSAAREHRPGPFGPHLHPDGACAEAMNEPMYRWLGAFIIMYSPRTKTYYPCAVDSASIFVVGRRDEVYKMYRYKNDGNIQEVAK